MDSVDDDIFIENSIVKAIEQFNNNPFSIINMRYAESKGRTLQELPIDYWRAHHHNALKLPGIPTNYKLAPHFLMSRAQYIRIGGLDASFDYFNLNIHDLIFRAQHKGYRVIDSNKTVSLTDHGQNDHCPIEVANETDYKNFCAIYTNQTAIEYRSKESYLNSWKNTPEIWETRFNKNNLPTSYQELI